MKLFWLIVLALAISSWAYFSFSAQNDTKYSDKAFLLYEEAEFDDVCIEFPSLREKYLESMLSENNGGIAETICDTWLMRMVARRRMDVAERREVEEYYKPREL